MNDHTNALDEAIRRSRLSSSNQMEMLTFRLTDNQLYGINVFKIIEILECPKRIDKLPHSHPAIKGIVSFRGQGITVIDVSEAIGMPKVDFKNELAYLVVCEYNNQLNAFLVKQPETLLTRGWDEINKPEGFQAPSVIAIAYADDGEMILILDIETILVDVVGMDAEISPEVIEQAAAQCSGKQVLLVDDSNSAMSLMKSTMDRLGVIHTEFSAATNALDYLEKQLNSGQIPTFDLIISDIEMPGMDGFTFTRRIRELEKLTDIPIALHSSMSNPTNRQKAKDAGANEFVAKFDPEALTHLIIRLTEK